MQSPEQHTILIVEDEVPIALMERKVLEAEGFAVEAVANGTAALERLEHDEPDLVLLDHRLPDMNGAEVVQALGERLKTLPVIMVAARGDERLAVDMHEAGVADYVCKDVELSFVRELPKTVRAAIDRFALEAENRMLQARLRETHDELERKVGDRTARLAAANEQLRKEIIGRTRLEHDLREAEREKALILDSLSSEIINYSDTECRIKWVNRAGAEAAGARPEDLVGRYCYEVWSDRNAPCEGCPVVRCMRSGKPEQGEMTTPDGRVWLLRGSPVRDEEGKVIGAAGTALEVTERKRAEEALRQSEQRFRTLVEQAADAVFLVTMQGKILDVNQQACDSLGYTREELLSMTIAEIDIEVEIHGHRERFWDKLAPGRRFSFEGLHRRKDGTTFPVEANVGLLELEGQRVMLGLARDISERKRAQEELQEERNRLQSTVDAIDAMEDGLTIQDKEYNIVFQNRVLKDIFEGLGRKCYQVYEGKDRVCEACPVEMAFNDGQSHTSERKVTASGGPGYWETSANPLRNAAGEIVACLEIARNITERKRAEAALRARESLLNATLESTADGILVVNEKGQVTHSNARLAEMWRIPKELFSTGDNRELLTHAAAQLADPEGFLVKAEALNRSSAENYDTLVFNDGRVFERHACPLVRDGQIAGRVLSFRDLTDRKQAEERARTHLAELAHASRVSIMGEMAGGLAHELNQPLGAIVNYADACAALMRSGSAAPEDLYGEMEKVSAQARRAGEIIRRLSNFVLKREHGRSTVLINDLVREVVNLVRADVRSSGVVVGIEPGDDLPMLSCDSIQIEQVILNLIQNARDALQEVEPGARRVTIRTARAANDAVEIAVSDNGPGMPAEAAEQAFEPFFTTKAHGTGLGLSISRSIVEAHGGRLWATPNPDQGVTFRIHLPLTTHGDGDEPGGDSFHRG